MPNAKRKVLAVIGAGPKGLAVAVKAKVLSEFGLCTDRVVLIEKHGVAAHWTGQAGYTNGELKLGTSPEKDVVFPLDTDLGDDCLNQRIRKRLMNFSWSSFLVDTDAYSDWVDRGRPAPSHALWAQYLNWVAKALAPEVRIIKAEVESVDLNVQTQQWNLRLLHKQGREALRTDFTADRLMLTGPGKTRMNFLPDGLMTSNANMYDLESFWSELSRGNFRPTGRIALVGSGENSAAILLSLCDFRERFTVDVIAPKGFLATRSENYYENQFYSHPDENGWKDLTPRDRQEFIERTDLGVFSGHAMQILNDEKRHQIIPGRLTKACSQGDGVNLTLLYRGEESVLHYDQVIFATGFDHMARMRELFTENARQQIEGMLGAALSQDLCRDRIEEDLSLSGVNPKLFLPMLAGLSQGPGFANLSCLGKLSDRVVIGTIKEEVHAMEKEFCEVGLWAET